MIPEMVSRPRCPVHRRGCAFVQPGDQMLAGDRRERDGSDFVALAVPGGRAGEGDVFGVQALAFFDPRSGGSVAGAAAGGGGA